LLKVKSVVGKQAHVSFGFFSQSPRRKAGKGKKRATSVKLTSHTSGSWIACTHTHSYLFNVFFFLKTREKLKQWTH